jgi:hypothetical protein
MNHAIVEVRTGSDHTAQLVPFSICANRSALRHIVDLNAVTISCVLLDDVEGSILRQEIALQCPVRDLAPDVDALDD